MNIYQKVPEQFHKQYLDTLARLSEKEKKPASSPQRHSGKRDTKSYLWLRRIGYTAASAAAVFMAALILCAANPSLAASLPVIGTIFHAMQNRFGFTQIPETEAVILVPETSPVESSNPEKALADGDKVSEISPYQATDNGITLSVEEYYASNQSIFLGIRMVTDEPLPQDLSEEMIFLSTETYSFREDDPNRGNWHYEFERLDENTFLGILRIDYDAIRKDLRKYTDAVKKAEETGAQIPTLSPETESQYVAYYDIPEAFELDIDFTSLWVYHTTNTAGKSKESIKGSWSISGIPIRQSTEGMQSVSVKDSNAAGFGIDHIELSPLEMTIYPIEPADQLTFAVVLDKDGQMLRGGGDNCYQLAIHGHDISEITVYICDYVEYMDEIKEATPSTDPSAFRKVLEERCLYRKSIMINSGNTQ